MNPNFRRVALIAAGLGLVVSLFVALRAGDEEEPPPTTSAAVTTATTTEAATTEAATTTSTTEAPPATSQPTPATTEPPPDRPATISIVVAGGRPDGGIRRASVRRGREVVLRVTSDVPDHVHLHGYDLFADVAPGSPARLEFTADVPGRFEVELEDRGIQIADLEVRP